MTTKVPKIPGRSSLLNDSLDGMDELFAFPTKEENKKTIKTENQKNETELQLMGFDKLLQFPNHKFKLYAGQRLQDMVESIREYGILMPIIVWHHEGKYIILSGHNRVNAGKLAGLTECAAIMKENLTYEEAVLIVTETNLRQRSFDDLSHSEKAYCLKQHYEALKSQGRRNDLLKEIEELVNPSENADCGTSSENQTKLRTDEKLGEEYGLSRDNVAKYLKISTLISPLLDMLDDRNLSMKSAYDIAFVKAEKQQLIAELLESSAYRLDTKKSELIRNHAKNGSLTEDLLKQIITGEKTRKPKSNNPKPIQIRGNVIKKYFTEQQTKNEIEDTIEKALELYFASMSEEKEQLVG